MKVRPEKRNLGRKTAPYSFPIPAERKPALDKPGDTDDRCGGGDEEHSSW